MELNLKGWKGRAEKKKDAFGLAWYSKTFAAFISLFIFLQEWKDLDASYLDSLNFSGI